MTRRYVEIERHHAGKLLFHAFGKVWLNQNWIGRIMPQDIGKRVYLVGDVLQVENNEQLHKRLLTLERTGR